MPHPWLTPAIMDAIELTKPPRGTLNWTRMALRIASMVMMLAAGALVRPTGLRCPVHCIWALPTDSETPWHRLPRLEAIDARLRGPRRRRLSLAVDTSKPVTKPRPMPLKKEKSAAVRRGSRQRTRLVGLRRGVKKL
jgi:hypothetical protein